MDLKPRVFVSQRPGNAWNSDHTAVVPRIDLSPAESYGELIYLTTWGEASHHDTDYIARIIRSNLNRHRATEHDYVLCVGSVLTQVLACLLMSERTGGHVAMLHWDKLHKSYVVSPITLDRSHT